MFLNQENNGICAPIAVSMLDMKTSVQLVTTTWRTREPWEEEGGNLVVHALDGPMQPKNGGLRIGCRQQAVVHFRFRD